MLLISHLQTCTCTEPLTRLEPHYLFVPSCSAPMSVLAANQCKRSSGCSLSLSARCVWGKKNEAVSKHQGVSAWNYGMIMNLRSPFAADNHLLLHCPPPHSQSESRFRAFFFTRPLCSWSIMQANLPCVCLRNVACGQNREMAVTRQSGGNGE